MPKRILSFFAGDCRDNSAKDIWQGLKGELSDYFYNKILEVPSGENTMGYASIANDSFELALKRMENIIRKNGYDFIPGAKRLDAVVSPSDNITAGIIKAFENCGYPKEQLPLIIGTDISKRRRAYLKENSLYMTVLKNNNELHDAILSIANALKSGKRLMHRDLQ